MEYKRKTREMSQSTKDKISAKLTGRKHTLETRKKISDGQKRAWAKIPNKQTFEILWGNNNDKICTRNGNEKTN